MKSVRGLSIIWDIDSNRGGWPFFVKALEFLRKNVIAFILSLVPRRSGRHSICDTLHRAVWCFS